MVENCALLGILMGDMLTITRFVATEDGILQYQVNTIQRCQIAGSTWI